MGIWGDTGHRWRELLKAQAVNSNQRLGGWDSIITFRGKCQWQFRWKLNTDEKHEGIIFLTPNHCPRKASSEKQQRWKLWSFLDSKKNENIITFWWFRKFEGKKAFLDLLLWIHLHMYFLQLALSAGFYVCVSFHHCMACVDTFHIFMLLITCKLFPV